MIYPWMRSLAALVAGAMLASCASPKADTAADSAAVPVSPDRYDATFNAARTVLRDRGFILERVDAAVGVITTQPKTTAGLVTPWDREQQSFAQEMEDLVERQQRVVRITFDPTMPEQSAATDPSPCTMRVHVTVQRVQLPGRKIEPEAVSQTSYYWDPELGSRGMQPGYAVAYKSDPVLAARLAGLIEQAAGAPAASTPPHAAPAGPEQPPPSQWVPGTPLKREPAP